MQYRRRVPRQPAGWQGTCLVEDELATVGWRECRVIDISMLGVGITLRHRQESDLIGRNISVELPATNDSVSVRLEGVVKHAETTQPGTVRLGIEFVGLSEGEQVVATVLSALTESRT
jgi:hypothetical protein